MSTNLAIQRIAIIGVMIFLAALAAGCTSTPGTAPVTTQATPVMTTAPTATTLPPTTAPVVTTSAAPVTTQLTTLPVITTTAAPATPTTLPAVAVTIQNFVFSPASVTVPAGTTVTWTNLDTAPHQVASDTQAFSSIALGQGGKYSFTFTTPGTYPYHCSIHTFMKGTITVT